jgi:hypothetical protein
MNVNFKFFNLKRTIKKDIHMQNHKKEEQIDGAGKICGVYFRATYHPQFQCC